MKIKQFSVDDYTILFVNTIWIDQNVNARNSKTAVKNLKEKPRSLCEHILYLDAIFNIPKPSQYHMKSQLCIIKT